MLKPAIAIFESAYPGCQTLFLFDNTTSYSAYTADVLRASSMNLHPGGAPQPLRSGINSLTGKIQAMVQLDGTPKGLQIVLQERGL